MSQHATALESTTRSHCLTERLGITCLRSISLIVVYISLTLSTTPDAMAQECQRGTSALIIAFRQQRSQRAVVAMGQASSSGDDATTKSVTRLKFKGMQRGLPTERTTETLEVPVAHRWALVLFKDDSFSLKV